MSGKAKAKTSSVAAGGAYRDGNNKIVTSEDFQVTRAKEPIFGPAVPLGEEYEFPLKEYAKHEDVIDTVEATVYDVLNGVMPQQKGEFVLRAMGTITKSLIARSDANGASSANAAIGEVLKKGQSNTVDPDLAAFEQLIAKADSKVKST